VLLAEPRVSLTTFGLQVLRIFAYREKAIGELLLN
jgi:hypothetical protein